MNTRITLTRSFSRIRRLFPSLLALSLVVSPLGLVSAQSLFDPDPHGEDPCDNPLILCGDLGNIFASGDAIGEKVDKHAEGDLAWGAIYWLAWWLAPKVVDPEDWPPKPGEEDPPEDDPGGDTENPPTGGTDEPTGGGTEEPPPDGTDQPPTDGSGGESEEAGGVDAQASSSLSTDSHWVTIHGRDAILAVRESLGVMDVDLWMTLDDRTRSTLRMRILSASEVTDDPAEFTVHAQLDMTIRGDGGNVRVQMPLRVEANGESVFFFSQLGTPATRWMKTFLRGDGNEDGLTDISDAILSLDYQFLGNEDVVECPDALDVDDSGSVEITDPIQLLRYLFLDGVEPRTPFGNEGFDPTVDSLECH